MNIISRAGLVFGNCFLFFCLLTFFTVVRAQNRDGKLLQGEKWQKFVPTKIKADFYVSPTGNDRWSGTLSEPNATLTDGPFATLEKAREAVRILKSKVYFPKG